MKNPFVTKGYGGPEYFCDRIKETSDLVNMLTNENNMALISPRRLGKTDLIHHCFRQPEIKDNYYTFVIDIYATSSLRDFVNVFGKAILDTLKPLGRKALDLFVAALKSLQQELTFDIHGFPVWSVGLGNMENPSVTLDEIFSYLASADRPCIVAIDEFQQITSYRDGQNVEAALRTHVQRCPNATFLFAGSKRHLMGEIFTSPARPFFQSVITMGLAPISVDKYQEFAAGLFAKNGKHLDEAVVHDVYVRFNGITSYLQRVMNVLYLRTPEGGQCGVEMVDDAIDYLLGLYSDNFQTMLGQMSEKQRALFGAIVMEGGVRSITGGKFMKKYRLWSASSVASALKGLLDKDFVTQENGVYMAYDLFFALWLQRR